MSANGVTYRGVLVEVTEEDVKLRGKTGWIIIPFQQVRRIEKANQKPVGLDPLRNVSSASLWAKSCRYSSSHGRTQ